MGLDYILLYTMYSLNRPACCGRLLSPGRGGGGGSSPQIQAQGFSSRSSSPAHEESVKERTWLPLSKAKTLVGTEPGAALGGF